MKKSNHTIRILLLIGIILGSALVPNIAEQMDVIVLLDTSESMFPYFDTSIQYIMDTILNEYVRYDDQFHLLSFNSHPVVEITRKIQGQKDLEDILARILLLQPFGKHTDLVYALKYLQKYAADLPLQTKKTIIILTDGIHDPPPDSNFPAETPEEIERNRNEVSAVADSMRKDGWDVNLYRYPSDGSSMQTDTNDQSDHPVDVGEEDRNTDTLTDTSSYRSQADDVTPDQTTSPDVDPHENDMFSVISETMDIPVREHDETADVTDGNNAIGMPKVTFPDHLGTVTRNVKIPFLITNFSDQPILVKLERIEYDGVDILNTPVSKPVKSDQTEKIMTDVTLPKTPAGDTSIQISLVFGDDLRISPLSGTLTYTLSEGEDGAARRFLIFGAIGLVLVAIALTLVFLSRSRRSTEDSPADRVQDTQHTKEPEMSGILSGVSHRHVDYNATRRVDYNATATAERINSSVESGAPEQHSRAEEKSGRFTSVPIGTSSRKVSSKQTISVDTRNDGSSILETETLEQAENSVNGDATSDADASTLPTQSSKKENPITAAETFSEKKITEKSTQFKEANVIGLAKGEKLPKIEAGRTTGDRSIEMFVIGQNHLIGFRNIHQIQTGRRLSVGGKKRSGYRIFLIPLPAKIGELTREQDGTLTFLPANKSLFPDLEGPLHDCLNRYIRIQVENRELYFYFKEWESPLEKLNKLMHIVDKPGKPDFTY